MLTTDNKPYWSGLSSQQGREGPKRRRIIIVVGYKHSLSKHALIGIREAALRGPRIRNYRVDMDFLPTTSRSFGADYIRTYGKSRKNGLRVPYVRMREKKEATLSRIE